NWPAGVDGLRFQALARTAAKRWGLRALTWTSLKAGRRDGFDVAGFSSRLPAGALGVETDYASKGRVVERDLALRADANWNAGPGPRPRAPGRPARRGSRPRRDGPRARRG